MFMVMAACAISFTSCGNKAQQAPADETEAAAEAVEVDVDAAINEATAQLSEQIEAQDANKLQDVIAAVQQKISEFLKQNPEAAKEYVAKIQDFLKENAEKIKAFAGENEAVQAALATITAAPAETVVDGLMQALNGAKEAAEGAVEDATDAVKDAAEDAQDAAKEKAGEAVDAAADQAKKALGI